MPVKNFVYPGGSPVRLRLRAGYAQLRLTVEEGPLHQATAEITGSQKTLDKITERHGAGSWEFTIPNEGGSGSVQVNSFGRGGNVTTTIRGNASGVFMSGGDVRVGNIRGGGISVGRGGRVVVDGVDVTSYVNEQRGAGGEDEPELSVRIALPAGSTADLKVDEGDIQLQGDLAAQAETHGGNVSAAGLLKDGSAIKTHNGDIQVHAAGDVSLETHNGSIELDAAQGQTMLTTHNGYVRAHAVADIPIMAASHNGNVDITKAPGTNPRVMASTHNGRVRKP